MSEESYYKIYGNPTLELKEQIEKAIKEKFNETSDILGDFNWNDKNPEDYFLYSMLKKEFEFPKVFSKLDNSTFGNYENVKYFGINKSTNKEVREQVQVLYYNSKEDFAIKLITKSNDEVIISRGSMVPTEKIRNFIVDDTFCIFLKEKDKELPYFAAEISDISKIQK